MGWFSRDKKEWRAGFDPREWTELSPTPAPDGVGDWPVVSPSGEVPPSATAVNGSEVYPDAQYKGILWQELYRTYGPIFEHAGEVWLKQFQHPDGRIKLIYVFVAKSAACPGYLVAPFVDRIGGQNVVVGATVIKEALAGKVRCGIRSWPK